MDKTKNTIKESYTLTNYQKKVKTVFVILLFWLLRHHICKLPQCQNVLVCKWYLRVLSQLTHSFQQNIFILITSHRYIWKTYLINIFILHIVSKFETLVHIRKLLMRQKIKSIWNVKDTTTISTEETTK